MTSTYKNTNNCLLFFTAKFFLDAIDTLFQFQFVETKDRWILEFRPVGELIWQRKPISIALTTNHIEQNTDTNNYYIVTNDNNVEEDIHILKTYNYLHALLIEALHNPDLKIPYTKVSVSDIKIFKPYHFEDSKFSNWLKQPGQTTLRISNAGTKDNYANIYLAFNNWKYIQLAKRETANKKRKFEPEVAIETLPESQSVPIEIVVQP
jgi:hypothetical protein